jgi:hypothetical protein
VAHPMTRAISGRASSNIHNVHIRAAYHMTKLWAVDEG